LGGLGKKRETEQVFEETESEKISKCNVNYKTTNPRS
jgi:hypothetical protein